MALLARSRTGPVSQVPLIMKQKLRHHLDDHHLKFHSKGIRFEKRTLLLRKEIGENLFGTRTGYNFF